MIQPNELRINNIIHQGKVKSIYYDGAVGLDDGNFYPCDSLSGEKLTPEWLKRFGFKRGDNVTSNDSFFVIVLGASELAINPNNGVVWISNKSGSINNPALVVAVHQLQNLYFALTGKELSDINN